jgi:hypothetical protein
MSCNIDARHQLVVLKQAKKGLLVIFRFRVWRQLAWRFWASERIEKGLQLIVEIPALTEHAAGAGGLENHHLDFCGGI